MCEQQGEKVEMESNISKTENEKELSTNEPVPDTESSEQTNPQAEEENKCVDKCQLSHANDEKLCPLKTKETSTGTKVKRKAKSTRRKLNSLINNTSLHFSDTDSEGELITIAPHIQVLNYAKDNQQAPIISITSEATDEQAENRMLKSLDVKETLQCTNFVENLTDVDEIYLSETEDQKENENCLKVDENSYLNETELEDLEGGDEVETMIYVKPRSDIFCEYSGGTIITKESDGPFSIEVRNKMHHDDISQTELCSKSPDIVVMLNTDEEDIAISDEDDLQEVCCSQKEFLDDLDALTASQIVMKNINKTENLLVIKDTSDDGISDCHTDIEEVDPIE